MVSSHGKTGQSTYLTTVFIRHISIQPVVSLSAKDGKHSQAETSTVQFQDETGTFTDKASK